jgi:murein DD-endopeptidase
LALLHQPVITYERLFFMIEMPELKSSAVKRSPWPGVAVIAAVCGLIAGGIYLAVHRVETSTAQGVPAAPANPTTVSSAEVPVAVPAAPSATDSASAAKENGGGPQVMSVTLNGPIEAAVVASVGKAIGAPLTQVINRSLVWWLSVPKDVVKGDTLDVVYETRPSQEPLVHAVRYHSSKMGKTFEAVRLAKNGRSYQPDGTELEERLVDAPLDTYEQITSLLRDGRKHKGVDFKTPVGTPVMATFNGQVVRKNWNFRSNGNSLELAEDGGKGRHALFLHLSEIDKSVQVGTRFKKGQTIGKSGNSGHSFAPHLHYQLMLGDTVLDPFDSHQTTRAHIGGEDKVLLEEAVEFAHRLLPHTDSLAKVEKAIAQP